MRWRNSWKHAPSLIAVGIFYVAVNATMGFAQQAATSPPHQLAPMHTLLNQGQTRFPGPAPLATLDEMKCDAQGNIYAVYSDTPQVALSLQNGLPYMPVRKISMESDNIVAYPVPAIPGYVNGRRFDFDVGSQGHLYVLMGAAPSIVAPGATLHEDYFIAEYDDSGNVTSYVRLGPIPGKTMMPLKLAAFANGNFLVAGLSFAGSGQQVYAAVYNSKGTVVSQISIPSDITSVPPGSPTPADIQAARQHAQAFTRGVPMSVPAPVAISYTRAIGSSDGNAYILWGTQPQQMYVVSPAGEVVHKYNLAAAAPGARALQLGVLSTGQVWVQFYPTPSASSSSGANKVIEVLDASTGQVVNAFELGPSDDDRAMAGCSTPAGNFLFLNATQDAKALQVLTYAPAGD